MASSRLHEGMGHNMVPNCCRRRKSYTAIPDLPSVGTSCSPWQLRHPLRNVQNWVCLVPCQRCPRTVPRVSEVCRCCGEMRQRVRLLKFATEVLVAGPDFHQPDDGRACAAIPCRRTDMCLSRICYWQIATWHTWQRKRICCRKQAATLPPATFTGPCSVHLLLVGRNVRT
jgi:hypothetical protein